MLELQLLGAPAARVVGRPLTLSGKPLALLALMALKPGLTRAEVAGLLWDSGGGQSLRQALSTLRKLPDAQTWLADGERLEVQATLDARAFEEAVARGDQVNAIELWRGPLLDGLHVAGAAGFQEWLEIERHRLERMLVRALRAEAARLEAAGEPNQAIALLDRLLSLDALDESAVQNAMRLEVRIGQRGAALERLSRFRNVLEREMKLSPTAETLAIVGADAANPLRTHSSLSVRLARAQSLEPDMTDPVFWANVLEVEAFELAEASAELEAETLGIKPGDVPTNVRQLLHARIAQRLEPDAEQAAGPEAHTVLARVGMHWLRALEPRKALTWLERAAANATRSGKLEAARSAHYRVIWIAADEPAKRDALAALGSIAAAQNDLETLSRVGAELERLAQETQDDLTFYQAHQHRANEHLRRGQPADAATHAEDAVRVARRLGRADLEHSALGALGGARLAQGDLMGAEEAFNAALSSEDPAQQMRAFANLGAIHGMRGEFEPSIARFEDALTLARATNQWPATQSILHNLGSTEQRLGRYTRAETHFRDAVLVARRVGAQAGLVTALLGLATIHTLRGDFGPAWNTADEALDLCLSAAPAVEGLAQRLLGELEMAFHRVTTARERIQRSLTVFEASRDTRNTLNARAHLALLDVMDGQSATTAQQALEALRVAGHADLAARGQLELALLSSDPEVIAASLSEHVTGTHFALLERVARERLALIAGFEPDPDDLARVLKPFGKDHRVAELPLALAVLASGYERTGRDQEASTTRIHALELRRAQAEGLPRTQREACLAWSPLTALQHPDHT
jgi:DNA-binding SARP family transcriptional activator/Tfp pilus assembly protein PilF